MIKYRSQELTDSILNMKETVLIVDDSSSMRALIRETLEEEGYHVVGEASNGESAIDQALEYKPDLITLDLILPNILGLDVLRILKDEENFNSNVIIISAVDQESVIRKGKSMGVDDYIIKPFTKSELIQTIKKIYQV